MFYDKDLMNSKFLGRVWRAGNHINCDSDEDISMKSVCENLDSWVDSDHNEVHRRLSLRTSAVFVDGAARLYKHKIEKLFNDIINLDREMSLPKRSCYLTISSNGSESSNDDIMSFNSVTSNETELDSFSNSITDEDVESDELRKITTDQHNQENSTSMKIDKEVQTNLEETEMENGSFDKNLPFGFVVVHDNYHSRMPSKIIISSFNPDIVKLV